MSSGQLSKPLYKAVTVLEVTGRGHEQRREHEDAKLCKQAIRMIKRMGAKPGKRRKR